MFYVKRWLQFGRKRKKPDRRLKEVNLEMLFSKYFPGVPGRTFLELFLKTSKNKQRFRIHDTPVQRKLSILNTCQSGFGEVRPHSAPCHRPPAPEAIVLFLTQQVVLSINQKRAKQGIQLELFPEGTAK